jgi:hypothetical protein
MSRDSVALYRAAFRFVTLRDILPDFIPRQSDRASSKAEAQSPFAAEAEAPGSDHLFGVEYLVESL